LSAAVPHDALSDLLVPSSYRFVEGWGMVSGAYARVLEPRSREELQAVMATCHEQRIPICLRGSGRSYGDANHSTQGIVIDLRGVNRILGFDAERGQVEVEGGVSFEQLWKYLLPLGHWPSVVPGTMAPTMAGAAAMNVHGKNNFKVGATGDQILELDLVLPSGEVRTTSRQQDPELFRAVIGSMGFLGCISRLVIQTKPVYSGQVRVAAKSAPNLRAMMEDMAAHVGDADYLVGWVDGFAKGPALGRGLTHIAYHLKPGEDPNAQATLQVSHQELPASILGFPKSEVWRPLRLLNHDRGMRLLNSVKHFMGKREAKRKPYLQSHAGFNFLLDYVPNWKFAYGRQTGRGLIQYQPFVPKERAAEVFERILELCQERGFVAYLGVLKRHRPDDYLLTHALDGWSLALDFKVDPKRRGQLWDLCDAMTEVVLEAGGRFYFAKDLVLGAGAFQRFLPADDLAKFRALKRTLDPHGVLQSDLYRRIFEPLDHPGPLPLTDF